MIEETISIIIDGKVTISEKHEDTPQQEEDAFPVLQDSTIIPERQEVIIPTHIDDNAQDSPDSTIECTDDDAYPSGHSDDLMIFELHEADNLCEEALSLVNNVNDIFNTMDYHSNLVAYGNCRMPYKDITNNNACSNIDEGKIKNSPERHEISSTCEQENIIDFKKNDNLEMESEEYNDNDYVPESRSETSSSDEEISRIKQNKKCHEQ